jgi:hypothetical protein
MTDMMLEELFLRRVGIRQPPLGHPPVSNSRWEFEFKWPYVTASQEFAMYRRVGLVHRDLIVE